MSNQDRENTKLWDVLFKIIWWGTPSKSISEYWNWAILWASVKDMKEWVYKLNQTEDSITELWVKMSSTNIIPKWNIIISTRMWLWRWFINNVDVAINQDLKWLIINPKLVDRDFLFWLYITKSKEIENLWNGSTVKWIRIEDFKNIDIILPPLPTQQRIAFIFNKYDDLIENNNQRIKILEQEAELIYKERFVKFKFPGHEDTKMVDSGTEFGEIPEWWEVKSMINIDLFRMINENVKSFDWAKVYLETSNINWINIVWEWQIVSMDNKPSRAQKQPINNSIWFARMANSYKVLCFSDINKDITENTLLSSGMIWFETNRDFLSFLFFTINNKWFHEKKDLFCTWSTQVSLTNEWLEQIKIIVPKVDLIKGYWNICNKLINEILSLQKQNENLRKTRDMLLPKLITGEVEV